MAQFIDRKKILEDFKAQHRQFTEESMTEVLSALRGKITRASKDQYDRWLNGYLESGITDPVQYMDCSMAESGMLDRLHIAVKDLEVGPLYGSLSMDIIVPENVRVTINGDVGHNTVFLMKGFGLIGSGLTVFENTLVTPGNRDILEEIRAEGLTQSLNHFLSTEFENDEWTETVNELTRRSKEALAGKLVRASREDYDRWLAGYLDRGELPTSYEPFPFNQSLDKLHLYLAVRDCEIGPLYGSNLVNVIVPEHVKVTLSEDLGHNTVYLMEGFQVKSSGEVVYVPVYKDTEV